MKAVAGGLFALTFFIYMFYLAIQGVHTGVVLYGNPSCIAFGGWEAVKKDEKPARFWLVVSFYFGLSAAFLHAL